MTGSVIKLEIPCDPRFVKVARKIIQDVASLTELTPDQIEELKLASGEACSNAVKFGSQDGHPVKVECCIKADRLEVEIQNVGEPFKVGVGTLMEVPLEKLPEGGLGIYLIDQVTDGWSICSDCGETTVKLVKRFHGSLAPDEHQNDTDDSALRADLICSKT